MNDCEISLLRQAIEEQDQGGYIRAITRRHLSEYGYTAASLESAINQLRSPS